MIIAIVLLITQPLAHGVLDRVRIEAYQTFDFVAYSLVNTLFGGLQGLAAIAGLILGLVATRGRARALAGIGVGACATILIGLIVGYLIQPLFSAY